MSDHIFNFTQMSCIKALDYQWSHRDQCTVHKKWQPHKSL